MAHLDFEEPLVELENRIATLKALTESDAGETADIEAQIERLEAQADELQREVYDDLSVWKKVRLSRHPDRPYFRDYLEALVEDFEELRGDRAFGDDRAIITGFGRFDGEVVAVVGHQKGRTAKQKARRNFGMPRPEGYRKAVRVMKLAARFGRPVITFVDTPGAYPGIGAEERGQAEAIGDAILAMSELPVPIVSTVVGEGGSGGALGLAVANRILMLQYATYSVITPEGCASILWRDAAHAADAASALKLLAADALALGVVDEIIEEPPGGAHRKPEEAIRRVGEGVARHLSELRGMSPEALREDRYARFRQIGQFLGA